MLAYFTSALFDAHLAPWQAMISLALAIYAAAKVATWWPARHRLGAWRGAAYLLGWVGMDPRPFFERRDLPLPTLATTLAGANKLAVGIFVVGASATFAPTMPIAAGLAGLTGLVLVFHFGSFHLLALAWRRAGFDVREIMNEPLASTSLVDFWSRRWNLAFRDLAHRFVFLPLANRIGALRATVAVFAASGVIHDIVISLPARGGYGLPTLYFLLQAACFSAQRTRLARRLRLASGTLGRLTTMLVVVCPAPLLFHEPFLERVMLPLVVCIHSVFLK
jgi:hypothetical protein